jgi:hypothetical protein
LSVSVTTARGRGHCSVLFTLAHHGYHTLAAAPTDAISRRGREAPALSELMTVGDRCPIVAALRLWLHRGRPADIECKSTAYCQLMNP